MRYGPSSRHLLSSIAFAVVASVILSGCVTSKPTTEQLVDGVVEAETDVPVVASANAAPATGAPAEAQMAAMSTPPQTQALPTQPVPAQSAELGAIVMQGTGLQATSSSIFSTGGTVGASPVSGGGSQPASLFRSAPQPQLQPQPQPEPTPLPLGTTDAGYQVEGAARQPASLGLQDVAAATPVRTEAGAKTGTEAKAGINAAEGPSAQSLSLIGLFGAARKSTGGSTGKAGNAAVHAGMAPQQVAALAYAGLPGISQRSMFATVDDTAENHDDSSPAVELASLSGLARLAPSGLLLQTETVETGCFKPQLLTILKSVERHFGKKVLVTSGRRSLGHNIKVGGRPRSRHLTCEAADIQVAGISKWDVARFLRQSEGRGGVGTYCHTQSVHIDIGPRRDWNWQCGARDA